MVRWRTGFAVLSLAPTLVLAGCSQHKDASPPPVAATTAPSAELSAEDAQACDAVGTTIARMTAATAKWSPTLHPFDAKMNTKILGFANDLAVAADRATSEEIQTRIAASANAFADLATAMSGHNAAKVNDAIGNTKVEYATLKTACAL